MTRALLLAALLLPGCITVKFSPLPVVLSWGGITPDRLLVSAAALAKPKPATIVAAPAPRADVWPRDAVKICAALAWSVDPFGIRMLRPDYGTGTCVPVK